MTGRDARRRRLGLVGLAIRLAASGGREQAARLVVTAVGVGLGVVLLLLAAAAFPAIRAHETRDAWTDTSAHNTRPGQDERNTDALLWRERGDGYAGRDIVRVDVAPTGSRPPLPPGVTRLPAPGELLVSPARWATPVCVHRTRSSSSSATTRRSCAASPASRRCTASKPPSRACR